MWVHVLAVAAFAVLPVIWWAVQHASGGEKAPECGGHEGLGCSSCGTRGGCEQVGETGHHHG